MAAELKLDLKQLADENPKFVHDIEQLEHLIYEKGREVARDYGGRVAMVPLKNVICLQNLDSYLAIQMADRIKNAIMVRGHEYEWQISVWYSQEQDPFIRAVRPVNPGEIQVNGVWLTRNPHAEAKPQMFEVKF